MPKFVTVKEAANFLRLSESYLYRAIDRNEVPVKRFGRTIRVDLNAYLGLDVPCPSLSSLPKEGIPRKEVLWD